MRSYLAKLHKKSPEHKKRFALIASGSFTLLIFAIWAVVTFGIAEDSALANAGKAAQEANPFGSLMRGVEAGFTSLRQGASELKEGLEVIDFQSGYEEMREDSLNTYGQ